MKTKRIPKAKWLDIISSPFILALPIAIGIILVLPDFFNKYEAKLVSSGNSHKVNSVEEYHDLDGDGYSERVIVYNNTLGYPAMQVLHHDGSTVKQWDFTGRFSERTDHFYCGDMNNDGIKEIYLFTIKSDSLLMHAIAPFTENVNLFKNKLISKVWKHNDTVQVNVEYGTFYDLDEDGIKEMIFAVKAGFSLQPRGIYVYNMVSDSLYHSRPFGAHICGLLVEDIDSDGTAEIFCSCNTLGNIDDSLKIPFNDYSSWIMGFDTDLNFLFSPIEYDIFSSLVSMDVINTNSGKLIAAYFKNNSKKDVPSKIALINTKGKIIKQRTILRNEPKQITRNQLCSILTKGNTESLVFLGGSNAEILNDDLNVLTSYQVEGLLNFHKKFDLNNDGKDELIFRGQNYSFIITQMGFKDPVIINTYRNHFSTIPLCISIKKNGNELPYLFIKADNIVSFYTYKFNFLYYLKYPIWLGIYLFILSIILLIRYLLKIQLQRKMEMENRLNSLQLKTIKSQMDPHFMFNALNSISTNILNKQHDTAYRYLVKYSHLMRLLFTKADMLAISLEEELAFVEHYLELEQFRFKEKLTYDINPDPNTDQSIQLPRMFIQLFVENAIKHGLRHKEGSGHISIKTWQKNDHLSIIISDDGIGRQAAKKYKEGHGTGLKIIDEMAGLFDKVKGIRISYKYTDLINESKNPEGTMVIIIIPN